MEHVYVTCFQAKQCDAGGYKLERCFASHSLTHSLLHTRTRVYATPFCFASFSFSVSYEAVQIPLEIFDSSARDSLFQPTALTQLLQALVNEERALFLASRHSLDAENPDTSIVAFQNGLVFGNRFRDSLTCRFLTSHTPLYVCVCRSVCAHNDASKGPRSHCTSA